LIDPIDSEKALVFNLSHIVVLTVFWEATVRLDVFCPNLYVFGRVQETVIFAAVNTR